MGGMVQLNSKSIKDAIQAYENQQNRNLAAHIPSLEMGKLRPAAILMPLLQHEGRWHLLLTHRSQTLVEHRGQVAFPGGAREHSDKSLEETALRETYEEIGVNPWDVEVFGHLGDMPIVTGYVVRPYVAQIPWPYPLEISPDEVESAFIVPLKWLVDPDHRTVKYRSFVGREFPVIYFDHYDGHQLWGASAEMTLALLSALGFID